MAAVCQNKEEKAFVYKNSAASKWQNMSASKNIYGEYG